MSLNPLQQEFHDLLKQKEEKVAAMADLQAQYDDLRGQQIELNAKLKPIKEQLREAKAPIYEIDVRRAQIARSLQGQTGKPE